MKLLGAILRTPDRRIVSIGLLVAIMDQATKTLVRWKLGKPGVAMETIVHTASGKTEVIRNKDVIPGFFGLTYQTNTGVSFGFLQGHNREWAAFAMLALVVLFFYRQRFGGRVMSAGLGLICGGIIGNLIDRVIFGQITDFLDFYGVRLDFLATFVPGAWKRFFHTSWPAFNIADSAICIGVAIVLIGSYHMERHARKIAEAGLKLPP